MIKYKVIPGRPSFEVSNTGIVRNKITKKVLEQKTTPDGYKVVYIKDGSNTYPKERVHRLVYRAFKSKDIKGKEIDHIDGDKTNNNLKNLEIVAHRENMIRAVKNKLITSNREFTVKNINTGEIFTNVSITDLERYTGIAASNVISKIKNSNEKPINGYSIINPPQELNNIINNGGKNPMAIYVKNTLTGEVKKYVSLSAASYDLGLTIGFFKRRLEQRNSKLKLRSDRLPYEIWRAQ